MKRTLAAIITAATLTSLAVATPAWAGSQGEEHGRPGVYSLTGDEGGSKFEGIGADERRGLFYVSEVTGGEIHRGAVQDANTEEWLGGNGVDGRFTARGITVDDAGRVYIAGGPNGIGQPSRADLWIYSAAGELLAALRAPGDNVFLNDVAIGPDGAAYFTNSNAPQVYRVALGEAGWAAELWADGTGTIVQREGFNLGGIVVSRDRTALVIAQGNSGQLWRFDFATGTPSQVSTGEAELTNADGLVLRGSTLTVVRNFSRMIATLRLSVDGTSARLISQQATDPTRVLTTAKDLRGRTLFVDSKFDETVAAPPYEVLTNPFAS